MLWPSISITFQLKALYFSTTGSMFITSSTQPSIWSRFLSRMPTRLSSL